MSERSLETILQRAISTLSKELLLQCMHLTEIPDLSDCVWVEKLNLGNNKITKLDKKKLPPNIKILELYQNKLQTISGYDIPTSVEDLNLLFNDISEFDGSTFTNIKRLYISNNKTKKFIFPPNCTNVDISNNDINDIGDFPDSLKKLDCSNNNLSKFGKINRAIVKIDFSCNNFDDFPDCSLLGKLIFIDGSKNGISEIDNLPSGLDVLIMKDCKLTKINCVLPPSLTAVNLSDNLLTEMPDLPTNIDEIDLSDNRINDLKDIPDSVKILDVSNNCLTEIPDELKKRKDLKLDYKKNFIGDNSDGSDNEFDLFWSTGGNTYKKDTVPATTPTTYGNTHGTDRVVDSSATTYYGSSPPTTYYGGSPPMGYGGNNWGGNYYGGYHGGHGRWKFNHQSIVINTKAKKSNPNYVSLKSKKNIVV